MDLTIYLVGDNEEDAKNSLPFDSFESAEEYSYNVGGNVYSVTATID